jgi:nickel transport protein
MKLLSCALLCCWSALAQAHEVHHRIEAYDAIVVTLRYANGQPFAYERYALYPAGKETPQQVGNTDAQGRVAFVPDSEGKWRLQATSADGHGINLEFAVPAVAGGANDGGQTALPHWLLAGIGLALLFGLFGLIQMFARKKP